MPLIPGFRRQTQAELIPFKASLVYHSTFWDIWSYTVSPISNKTLVFIQKLRAELQFTTFIT